MENFITGSSGFLGKALLKRIEATSIPHDKIQTLKYSNFDKFFFFSTYGNLAHQNDTEAIVRANVLDLAYTLDQIKDKQFNSFIYTSTSSVNLKNQTVYSRTKKAGEELCLAYKERYNLPICIIRPYSITGVGEQPSHLIPKLINSCLYGDAIDFVAEPVHDFIDIDDMVDAIIALSENGAAGVYEIGSGVGTSNQEVQKIIEEITGNRSNTRRVSSMRPYDTRDWVCRENKAFAYGWSPKKPLKLSIREQIDAIKQT